MSVFMERVGATTIFNATTTTCSSIGPLRITYAFVLNPILRLNQTVIKVTNAGKNIITTTLQVLPNGTVLETQKVNLPYTGVRNVRLRYTPKGNNRYIVTGVIDGKAIVPYVVTCTKNGCPRPKQIRFKSGGVVSIKIDKKSQLALAQLYRKFSLEVARFFKGKAGGARVKGRCEIACAATLLVCQLSLSFLLTPLGALAICGPINIGCLIACSIVAK